MHKSQVVTLVILATLWTLGGLRLIWSGSFLLMAEAANVVGAIMIGSVLLALAIGFGKGKFVLQKTAQRSIDAIKELEDKLIHWFIGWAKVLGIRGFIVIGLMIGLGILLASDISPLNSFGRGLVRIAIGSALLVGSLRFWSELKDNIKVNPKVKN
ncbi:MAG: hypothetical protein SFU25_02580 [Candidatus Caenarcaniphilales bacterium]|nr:hypothetical protein [Candidatus Caenarcaniphilales bacterium]